MAETPDITPRKLTPAELNHLYTLLCEAEETGDYFGNREQYYKRTERLKKWCSEQIDEKLPKTPK